LIPQISSASPTQMPSQPLLQQYGSDLQTEAAQGLQPASSFGPAVQISWAHMQVVAQAILAASTQAWVQLCVQHVGFVAHTFVMHGSPPQSMSARLAQAGVHAGPLPVAQQFGSWAQT
jgi:hypothetical protein